MEYHSSKIGTAVFVTLSDSPVIERGMSGHNDTLQIFILNV